MNKEKDKEEEEEEEEEEVLEEVLNGRSSVGNRVVEKLDVLQLNSSTTGKEHYYWGKCGSAYSEVLTHQFKVNVGTKLTGLKSQRRFQRILKKKRFTG